MLDYVSLEGRMSRHFLSISVIADRFPRRSETFITEHVVGLARRGYRVSVISHGPGEGITPNELEAIDGLGVERVQVFSFPGGKLRNLFLYGWRLLCPPSGIRLMFFPGPWGRRQLLYAAAFREKIQNQRADVVHVHFGHSAALLHHVGWRGATVVTWHGIDANVLPRLKGRDVYQSLFSSSFAHTVGSGFIRGRLKELGERSNRISIIPMGVCLENFPRKIREGGKSAPLNIISVGRLVPVKGHRFLIDAVGLLRDAGHAIEARIIGDGELREALQEQIQRLGLEEAVRLLGSRPANQVSEELRLADIFVLPGMVAVDGSVESQGVVFAEAQASGLPVIASDVGGVPDSIRHGETGILCPPGDVKAIAQAIQSFVQDPGKLQTFGCRGRAFVEKRFSSEVMLDSFEQLYGEIVGLPNLKSKVLDDNGSG